MEKKKLNGDLSMGWEILASAGKLSNMLSCTIGHTYTIDIIYTICVSDMPPKHIRREENPHRPFVSVESLPR